MLNKIQSKLSSDSNLKELVSGSVITFILKIVGLFLSYLLIYVIDKKNGSEGVGFYSLINNFLLILGIVAAMGTNVSVLRFVGQFNNEKDNSKLKGLYLNLIKLSLPVALIMGFVLFIFSDSISILISKGNQYSSAICLVGITLPFFTLDLISVEFIRGLKKLKISEFIRSVSRPLIILTCLFLYWAKSIENIYIIYFFCGAVILNSIVSGLTVILHLRKIPNHKTDTPVKELFKVSWPMMVTAIAGTLMASISIFFLEYFATTKEVGIYSVSVRLSMLSSVVLIVVNTISAPKFSELFWAKKEKELQTVVLQSVKMIFFGGSVISILIAFGSYPILQLFGEANEYVAGQVPLFILIAGQLFNSATGSVGLFLNMSGHQNILRNTALISLALQLLLSFILIPTFGMIGAAISAAAGGILWNLLCILYVKVKLNIKTYYFPSL